VYIADLKPTIFISSEEYAPEMTALGEQVLNFASREGLAFLTFPCPSACAP
jgi:hypothetical protein